MTALRVTLQLAATVLVTVFILRAVEVDVAALADFDLELWAWRPLPILGSVLLLATAYVASSLLWRRMVVEMGGPALPREEAVRVFLVANLGRYVPGKALQIAGLAVLAARRGVPVGIATGAAALGQAFSLAGATLLGLGALFGARDEYRSVGWIGVGVIAVLVLLTSIPGPSARIQRLWLRIASRRAGGGGGAASRGGDPSPGDGVAATAPTVPVRVGEAGFGLRWTALYLLIWAGQGAAFWLLFLGVEEWATFLDVAPLFAAAYVLGYLALFAPAGGGVREGALVAFLLPVTGGAGSALALALLARIWTTAVEVVPVAALVPGVLAGGREVTGSAPEAVDRTRWGAEDAPKEPQ